MSIPQSLCRIGVARCDVTPPVGMYHRMWGAATHDRSTGVHRPLLATVLVVRAHDDSGGVVIVAVDHCILGDEDVASIRAAVASATKRFAADDVLVTLSHTHGAGLMMRDRTAYPGGDMIGPYLNDLAQRVATLAREAEQNVRPATILYATGRCDLAAQRDFFDEQAGKFVCGFNPGATADDTLLVARVLDAESKRTLATVVNYACHPTTLAWQNTLISPDFVGTMRETVESATGGAPCVFLQGASGDLGPREQYVGDTTVADRHGRRLGHAAVSALESLPPEASGSCFAYKGPVVSGALLGTWAFEPSDRAGVARFATRSWSAQLPYRTDLPRLAATKADRACLAEEEKAAEARGDLAAARDLHARVEQMTRQIMRLEAMPPGDAFPLRVSLLQLGDAVWVFVNGEHYSMLQTELRRRFPSVPLLATTVTNGWQPGYLPPREVYGKGIYQESIAMVAPGALEQLIEEIAREIAQRRPS